MGEPTPAAERAVVVNAIFPSRICGGSGSTAVLGITASTSGMHSSVGAQSNRVVHATAGSSRQRKPADVAAILNGYYAAIAPVIHRHGGVVNNCIGDGLFASFNLPLPQERHAAAALEAALEIQQSLAGVDFPAGVQIRTRIGINTGPVIGVTIGTADWLSYTLLGDAVNVASRVEQLNKQFGSAILATESTVRAAGDGFPCVRLGETDVRGHRGEVVVYRVGPSA